MYDGVEGFCEPYVSKADWDKVQASVEARKQDTKAKRVYMFSGLMKCPVCGSILSPTHSTSKYKSTVYEYKHYRCRHKYTKCGYKRILTELQLEREVLAKLPELIQNEIASVEKEAIQRKAKPKYNLAGLQERLHTLNASYMAGNKTDEEYINEGKEIKKLIVIAEAEAPEVERDLTSLKELLNSNFVALYSELAIEEKRRFWRNILKEIILDDNRVLNIILKY